MSIMVMGLVFSHYPVGGGEMLTMLKLADYANDQGQHVYPAVATIAEQTCQSGRQVQRHITKIIERGWIELVRRGGQGPGKTTVYRVRVPEIKQQLVGKGDKMSPIELRVTLKAKKGDISDEKGDIAVSPDPSLEATVKNRQSRRADEPPSAVAECFRRYSRGMKAKTGAEYPSNARANGQLAQVVKRVGAEAAPAVVEHFLASSDPYYAKTGWRLDSLVRDCERLYMAMKGRGGDKAEEPTVAEVEALCADDRTIKLQDYDIDEPMRVARKAGQEYTKLLRHKSAHSIAVKIGAQRSIFRLEELWA
ncbi:MAG TPA: helix-turn-helix domain-containing protein [Gemmatimonadales bacterium]